VKPKTKMVMTLKKPTSRLNRHRSSGEACVFPATARPYCATMRANR